MSDRLPPVKPPTEPTYRPDRVRLTVLVYRKPGMSTDDFRNYWRTEHSQTFAKLAVVRRNLLKYEQAHNNEDVLAKIKPVGFGATDCDGMAIFEATSYEKIFECFTDEEAKKIMGPDEDNFLDKSRSMAFPSQIVGIFDDPS